MLDHIVAQPRTMYAIVSIVLVVIILAVWLLRRRTSSGGPAGTDLGEVIRQLRTSHAQWPTISAALNPRNDATVSGLLKELRGPHMFVPHTALNIIEDAYASTFRSNPRASVRDVLKQACGSMSKVTRYGD